METKLKFKGNRNENKGKLKKKFADLINDDLYNNENELFERFTKKAGKRKKELNNFNIE